MINPTTGRTIFKTGKLGRKVQKMQSMKNRKTATSGRAKSDRITRTANRRAPHI